MTVVSMSVSPVQRCPSCCYAIRALQEQLLVAVLPDHPQAGRNPIELDTLQDEPLVMQSGIATEAYQVLTFLTLAERYRCRNHLRWRATWHRGLVLLRDCRTFAKLKAHLRRIAARSFDALFEAIGDVYRLFKPSECWNFFKSAGYASD